MPCYISGTCTCGHRTQSGDATQPPDHDPNKALAMTLNKHRWRRAMKKVKPKARMARRKKKKSHES